MNRKHLFLLGIGLCTVGLVGCENVRDLSENESELIAEYAAEMLLKYDMTYVDRMEAGNDEIERKSTELNRAEADQEPTSEQQFINSTIEKDSEALDETTKSPTKVSDIASVLGIDGAGITFKEYSIVEQYPEQDEKEEFINLEASEGYQLLVLKFDVTNNTDKILPVSLIDKELDYEIVCNGSNATKSMLTILMNDLNTLEVNVEPGKVQEAVLVFQISDSVQKEIDNMDLHIGYEGSNNVINIL